MYNCDVFSLSIGGGTNASTKHAFSSRHHILCEIDGAASACGEPNGRIATKWFSYKIGPIYTDSDGRFAFYNVPRGTYKMIIYRGTDIVWQQNVNVPNASLPPIVLH